VGGQPTLGDWEGKKKMAKTNRLGALAAVAPALVAMGLLALIMLVEVRRAEATFPGKNGKIAYQGFDGHYFEIYTIYPCGAGRFKVTNNKTDDYVPSWVKSSVAPPSSVSGGGVVNELANAGVLGNTYVFFTSDNGWHQGEHPIRDGKWRPYEEDVRMPLLVRGPGVAAGSTTRKLTLNTDYLPTFTDLAGAQKPSYVDGRSLRPVLSRSATAWRGAILLEGLLAGLPDGFVISSKSVRAYYGVRTSDGSKYVEYEAGRVRELYYLGADPYELSNKYAASAPPTTLASRLQALKGCAADSCRRAENGP
jgi:hypothetical protein